MSVDIAKSPPILVIAIAGPARAGKDSLAAALANLYNGRGLEVQTLGLAHSIWQGVRALIGHEALAQKGAPDPGLRAALTPEAGPDRKLDGSDLDLERAATPRQWAIALGEGARRHFDASIWIRMWWRGVSAANGVVIVPDVRRADELVTLRELLPESTQLRSVGVTRDDLLEVDQVWEEATRALCEIQLNLVSISSPTARANYYQVVAESLASRFRLAPGPTVGELRRRLAEASAAAAASSSSGPSTRAGTDQSRAPEADAPAPPRPEPAAEEGVDATRPPEPTPAPVAVPAPAEPAGSEPVDDPTVDQLYNAIRRTALRAGVLAGVSEIETLDQALAVLEELSRAEANAAAAAQEVREDLVESVEREIRLREEVESYRKALLGSALALYRGLRRDGGAGDDDDGGPCIVIDLPKRGGSGGGGGEPVEGGPR